MRFFQNLRFTRSHNFMRSGRSEFIYPTKKLMELQRWDKTGCCFRIVKKLISKVFEGFKGLFWKDAVGSPVINIYYSMSDY